MIIIYKSFSVSSLTLNFIINDTGTEGSVHPHPHSSIMEIERNICDSSSGDGFWHVVLLKRLSEMIKVFLKHLLS